MTNRNVNKSYKRISPYYGAANRFGTMTWDRRTKNTHRYTTNSEKAFNMRNASLGKKQFGKGLNPETGFASHGIAALGTLKRGVSKAGGYAGVGIGAAAVTAGLGMKGTMWLEKSRMNILKSILPNTAYPSTSGRFGVRTGGGGPAGIEGMRFNFRRK